MILINYILVCLIFGTTFLAIKVGIDASAPPLFSAGVRFFAAGLILFLVMMWRKKATIALLLRKETILTGICLTFGTFAGLYWGEQYVSSGIAAILSATGPLMILVLQVVFLRQRTSAISALGCVIGFTGVVLLLLPSLSISASRDSLTGAGVILIGEMFYATGALYSKRVVQRLPDTSPIALNASQMMYGGILLLILSASTEHVQVDALVTKNAIGSMLYLIVVGSMVGHSLFYWLVAKTNPVFPTTWLYVSPLIALAIGATFYEESITWLAIIGVATIITGTLLANWASIRQLLRRPSPSARTNAVIAPEVR